jgi:hypothetical protein
MYRRVQRGFVAGHRINIGVQNTGPEIGTEKKTAEKMWPCIGVFQVVMLATRTGLTETSLIFPNLQKTFHSLI